MAADSMFSVYETPWHGLGAVLKKRPKTIDEAIIKAGLDWDVEQAPLRAKINGRMQEIEGYFVNYCQHPGGHAFPGYATSGIFNFLFNSKM